MDVTTADSPFWANLIGDIGEYSISDIVIGCI
jgi:hypothetical protein